MNEQATPTTPQTSTPSTAEAILSLTGTPPAETPHAGPETPTPPAPVPQPVATDVKPSYRVVGKVNPKHKNLLAQGIHPRDIEHISYGLWRGCQCVNCKTKRNEMDGSPDNEKAAGPVVDDPFKELIDEEIAATVLNIDNKIAELLLRAKKAPKEAVELWIADDKELKTLGRLGKRVADIYLKVPDFKHKELAALLIYKGAQLSVRATTTMLILKTLEEEKKK